MKIQRIYSMQIQGANADYDISYQSPPPPRIPDFARILTLELDVTRNTLASANTAKFTLYNLKESTRRDIYHDRYDTTNYRAVKLLAGYASEPSLPTIFQGNVISAYSFRRGVDWVTEIEAFDGGFAMMTAQVNTTFPSGWELRDVISSLISTMPKVTTGAIGNLSAPSSRGLSLTGATWDVLNRLSQGQGAQAFVDNERVNVLQKNEYISNEIGLPLITSDTGLLGTPRRHNALIEVDVVFEPRAAVGQLVELRSIESVNNGLYQVIGIHHHGTISGAVDGGLTTTISLWLGTQALSPINAQFPGALVQ